MKKIELSTPVILGVISVVMAICGYGSDIVWLWICYGIYKIITKED